MSCASHTIYGDQGKYFIEFCVTDTGGVSVFIKNNLRGFSERYQTEFDTVSQCRSFINSTGDTYWRIIFLDLFYKVTGDLLRLSTDTSQQLTLRQVADVFSKVSPYVVDAYMTQTVNRVNLLEDVTICGIGGQQGAGKTVTAQWMIMPYLLEQKPKVVFISPFNSLEALDFLYAPENRAEVLSLDSISNLLDVVSNNKYIHIDEFSVDVVENDLILEIVRDTVGQELCILVESPITANVEYVDIAESISSMDNKMKFILDGVGNSVNVFSGVADLLVTHFDWLDSKESDWFSSISDLDLPGNMSSDSKLDIWDPLPDTYSPEILYTYDEKTGTQSRVSLKPVELGVFSVDSSTDPNPVLDPVPTN